MQPNYKDQPIDDSVQQTRQTEIDEKAKKKSKERTKNVTSSVLQMQAIDPFTEIDIAEINKQRQQEYVNSIKDVEGNVIRTVDNVKRFLTELRSQVETTENLLQSTSDKPNLIRDEKVKLLDDITNRWIGSTRPYIEDYVEEKESNFRNTLHSEAVKKFVEKYGREPNDVELKDFNFDDFVESKLSDSYGGDVEWSQTPRFTLKEGAEEKIDEFGVSYLKQFRDTEKLKSYWEAGLDWKKPVWNKNNLKFISELNNDIIKGVLSIYGLGEHYWEDAFKHNQNLKGIIDRSKESNYDGILKDSFSDDKFVQFIQDAYLFQQPQFKERPFVIEALKSTVSSLAALPMYMYGLGELKLMEPIVEIGWKTFAKNLLKSPFYTQLPTMVEQVNTELSLGHIKNYGDFVSLLGETYIKGLAEVIGEVSTPIISRYLPKGIFKNILSSKFGQYVSNLANKVNVDIEKASNFLLVQPFTETFEEEFSNLISGDPSIFVGDFNPRRLGVEAISSLAMGLPLSIWYAKAKGIDIDRDIELAKKYGIEGIELNRDKVLKLDDELLKKWKSDLNKSLQEANTPEKVNQFIEEILQSIGSKAETIYEDKKEEISEEFTKGITDYDVATPSEMLTSLTKPFVDGSLKLSNVINRNELQGKTYGEVAQISAINLDKQSTLGEVYSKLTTSIQGHKLDDDVTTAILDKVKDTPVAFEFGQKESYNARVNENGIFINSQAIQEGNNDIVYTLVHEGIHAYIGNRINYDLKFKGEVERLINNVYFSSPEIADFIDRYLIANYPSDRVAEEFITNLFSRESKLTEIVKSIPAPKREGFIAKIVDFIKDVLGLSGDNSYDKLKEIVFGDTFKTESQQSFEIPQETNIKSLLDQVSQSENEETKQVSLEITDPLAVLADETELSGLDEAKYEELLPELRQAQSIGNAVKQLVNTDGRSVFKNNKDLRDQVFALGEQLTHQQRYDAFLEMLKSKGVDFNNSLIQQINEKLINDTGLTYWHHTYHAIVTSTEQTVVIIDAQGNVTLIGKGTPRSSWVSEDGTAKSTVRRKKMYEVIQEKLKEKAGLDINIYEVAGFENIVPPDISTGRLERRTIKNSFKDFRPHKYTGVEFETAEDKMNLYRRRLMAKGFVVIPTEKTHLLLDARKFKMVDENGQWQEYNFDLGKYREWETWKGIFSQKPLVRAARDFALSEQDREVLRPYYNRTKLYKNKPNEKAIMDLLNNSLYDSVYSYLFYQFASRVLPGAPTDKDLFKRLNNLGGNASSAIIFDEFKKGLRTTREGNYMWLDGENVMFKSVVLDSSTLDQAIKLFGNDFKPGDGVAFILPQKRAMFNKINLQSKQPSIALKYKTFDIGLLLKKSDQVVTPETHPELWKFMISNGIAEINMDTAVKVGAQLKQQGKEMLTWQQIRNNFVIGENYIFDRNMMDDSIMFSKDKIKDVAKGILPTYVRGALLYLLKGNARKRVYEHFLSGFDKLQQVLDTYKDAKERLNALKKLAENNRNSGFSNSILRFIETLTPEYANVLSLDIFSDIFLDGVIKSLIQDSLNHAQFGSSLTLIPDVGNYKQYLLKSGQITTEQAQEYFDGNYLKDGYIIMDKYNYDKLKIESADNKVMVFVNPPSGYQDGRAMTVIGTLPKSMGVNGLVTPNSQLQIISGKDYDIDIAIPMPCVTKLLKDMWQDLKDLETDAKYKEDLKAFSNPTMALRLSLELNPEIQQAALEQNLTSYEALKSSDVIKGKMLVEPEDAHLAYDKNGETVLGLNKNFAIMSFKNPVSLNNFLAKLDAADIGRLYNIALFYTEFLQYENMAKEYEVLNSEGLPIGRVKIMTNPNEVSFNLTMLNRLTHLVLDWLNNLKLFMFEYDPDKVLNRLFTVVRLSSSSETDKLTDTQLFKMTAEKQIMSARRLLKFKETDKDVTFDGLMTAIKEASETYKEDTLIGKSAIRANEIDVSGFRLNNEQQAQVYQYVKDQLSEAFPPSWSQFSEKSAELLSALSELTKREGSEGYTNFDRLTKIKNRSEQIGIDIYYQLLKEMFITHSFTVSDRPQRTEIEFRVNENSNTGRAYTFQHVKDAQGQLTGKLRYLVDEYIDGKKIESQHQEFDEFVDMLKGASGVAREKELDKIFHRNTFPAYLFSDPQTNFILLNNEISRKFLRDFIAKTYNTIVENEQFKNGLTEVKRTFFLSTLGYFGKQYSLENIQMLKQYTEENKRVKTVSYTDALMLMNQSSDPIAQETFTTWLSTASEKTREFITPTENDKLSVPEFHPLLKTDEKDLSEFYELVSAEDAVNFYLEAHNGIRIVKLVSGDIIPYRSYEEMSEEDKQINFIIQRGIRIADEDGNAQMFFNKEQLESVVTIAKNFWIDTLFSSYDNLNRSLNRKKDVKKQVRKIMAKALKAGQEQPRDRILEFWARNLPFARTILMFSNRNKVYLPTQNVVTYFINGKEIQVKASEIASAFDLKYAEGTPIRLSGAMIDWYTRLQTHYEASNTQNILRRLTEKIIESLNADRGSLLSVNNIAQSTKIQEAAWNIAEGSVNILRPGEFEFTSNQTNHQIVYDGEFYNIATNSISNINLDEVQRLAEKIISDKEIVPKAKDEKQRRFKQDLLTRTVMAALQYRYIYDYVTPKLIHTQIDNMNSILNEAIKHNVDENYRSMTISMADQYINRLVNMLKQIDGVNERLYKKGLFYMPRTFEDKTFNYEKINEKLVEAYINRGFSEDEAKRRAQKDIRLMQDETRHEVNGVNPLHSSYLKRIYDDGITGYLKDYQVTHDYLDQLAVMFRFQNLAVSEAFNTRFLKQENLFMKHELRFMSAVARNSEYYYEPIKKQSNLSRGQFVMFQALKGDFWNLVSGEVVFADKDKINLIRADGSVEVFDRLGIKNLQLMHGVSLNKKFTLFVRKIIGIEPEWINKAVTFVSRNKLRGSNLAMLGTKPWYASRNVAGASFNNRAYFGNDDYNAGERMKEIYEEWLKNNNVNLSDIQTTVFTILRDHASAIMGDVDTIMGRFGGLLTLMQDEITPETVRLFNETQKNWQSAKEEFESLNEQFKSNPEDVGLKKRFATRIPQLIGHYFDKGGFQNIPFGFPIGIFLPAIKSSMYFNALEGEKYWRDRTVLTMAQVLASHFNLYSLSGEDKEIAEKIIKRFTISAVTHAINTTQFQYIPGFFLSHFDSTLNGKAWFKQFSHYANSMEWAYIGRIENALRQMEQFGTSKVLKGSIVNLMPFSKQKKLKYEAIIGDPNKVANMTFEEYIELSRAVRMTALAVFTAIASKLSRGARLLLRSTISISPVYSVLDIVFNNLLSEAASIPTIQMAVNWSAHIIGQTMWSVPEDDDDEWVKRWKKTFNAMFGQSAEEYVINVQKQVRREMGSDWVSGFYGDPAKYFDNQSLQDRMIQDDYNTQIFRDLFTEGIPFGVGEQQLIATAFEMFMTGFPPNNIRELTFNFFQTQMPFASVLTQLARGIEPIKNDIPAYNRVGSFKQNLKDVKDFYKENKPAKLGKIDLKEKVLEDYQIKTNESKTIEEQVDARVEEILTNKYQTLLTKVNNNEITKEEAEQKFFKIMKAAYQRVYGYGATGKFSKALSKLKLKYKFDRKELN